MNMNTKKIVVRHEKDKNDTGTKIPHEKISITFFLFRRVEYCVEQWEKCDEIKRKIRLISFHLEEMEKCDEIKRKIRMLSCSNRVQRTG